MKVIIDQFTNDNGWILNDCVSTITDWDDLRNDWLSTQLQFDFLVNGSAYKKFDTPIDISSCKQLTFTICDISRFSDLSLRIYVDGATYTQFDLEIRTGVVELGLPYSQIYAIEFISTLSCSVILSGFYAIVDEYPKDINFAIKESIEYLTKDLQLPIVGIANGKIGSDSLTITGQPQYVERFTAIKIDNDIYQTDNIKPINNNSYLVKFTQSFSGKLLVNTYIDSQVYLAFPVLANPQDVEGSDFAIAIENGFTPEIRREHSHPRWVTFSFDNTMHQYLRYIKGKYVYKPVIHGLYRNLETKAYLTNVFTQLSSNQTNIIYINGQRQYMECESLEENEFDNYSGELTLQCKIELEEFLWYENPNNITIFTPTVIPKKLT